jgi:hypothetical protein
MEDNIRMSLKDTEWEGVDWIHLAHGPVADTCELEKSQEFFD